MNIWKRNLKVLSSKLRDTNFGNCKIVSLACFTIFTINILFSLFMLEILHKNCSGLISFQALQKYYKTDMLLTDAAIHVFISPDFSLLEINSVIS